MITHYFPCSLLGSKSDAIITYMQDPINKYNFLEVNMFLPHRLIMDWLLTRICGLTYFYNFIVLDSEQGRVKSHLLHFLQIYERLKDFFFHMITVINSVIKFHVNSNTYYLFIFLIHVFIYGYSFKNLIKNYPTSVFYFISYEISIFIFN